MRLKFCSITMGILFISIRRKKSAGFRLHGRERILDIGSSGQKVKQIQEQLNLIGEFYNAIPVLVADGIYGERTAEAVKVFQRIFNLPQTGVVDFPTWYKISDQYVRLSGIAELM